MIYEFRDVIAASEGVILPSEALQINGEYIEDLISGYRTLNVRGREAWSPDVVTYAVGDSDGAKIQSRRIPERIITVTYQLAAASNEEFREAFNKLGGILNVKDAMLIFNDEQDKYFIGTPCTVGEVEPGRNAVVGEFEILCADPFKYSVVEYSADANEDENIVALHYGGTYPARPILQAHFHNEEDVEDGETEKTLTGGGDSGYIAFFTEDEAIVQLGDPEEVDGETVGTKSQTLVNQTFTKENSYGSAVKKQWAANTVTGIQAFTAAGSMAMKVSSYDKEVPANKPVEGRLLSATSKVGNPDFIYRLNYKFYDRTASSVKMTVTLTTMLADSANYFGKKYILEGRFMYPEAPNSTVVKYFNVKANGEYWDGLHSYTRSFTVTLSGLTSASAKKTFSFMVARTDDDKENGSGNLSYVDGTATIPAYYAPYNDANGYYLAANDYGSGSSWHGATITRTIPADAIGEVGAKNFQLTYAQQMHIGTSNVEGEGKNDTNKYGLFIAWLTDASGKAIAAVGIKKEKKGTKNADVYFYVNGKNVHKGSVDLSKDNKYFGGTEKAAKTSTIEKSGSKVTFNVAGINKQFSDPDIANAAVTKISFCFGQYGTKAKLNYNGLYWVRFDKHNCNTWREVPNKFRVNDTVTADCNSAEIRLNGLLRPELGALGNDWEQFTLKPGLNQIGFSYSDFVEEDCKPDVSIRYREVFL